MSRMYYKSTWEELVVAADQQIKYLLTRDVAPIAEKILKQHIEKDIYGAYTPKPNGWVNGTYQRRRVLNKNVTSIYDYTHSYHQITVTSTATASPAIVKGWSFHNRYPGAFLKLLEEGNMGIWRGGFSRPAVSRAQNEIDNSSKISSVILNGIKKRIGNSFKE